MQHHSQDLIHSIYRNCERNIDRNQPGCVEDGTKLAEYYIKNFRSIFTKELLEVKDLDELHDQLIDMLIEQEVLTKVVQEYIDIYDSIREVEADEMLDQILSETNGQTKASTNRQA